jgi:hypothetical protein
VVKFIIKAFCVYRLSRMITIETGPFRLFSRFRPPAPPLGSQNWIAEGFNCPFCLSVYVALFVMILPDKIVYWLALSGMASWLYSQEK